MTTKTEPLEELITRVRAERAARGVKLPKSGWEAVAGTMEDTALFREAARLGDEWRKAENKKP